TSNRTGRERPIRAASFLRISCHSGGARRTSTDRMRAATTQPPASRTQKTAAPKSQTITNHDKNCGERTLDSVARTEAGNVVVVVAISAVEAAGGALRMR